MPPRLARFLFNPPFWPPVRIDWSIPPRMTAQALIFDCDGTLADTMPIHYLAWRHTTQRYGLDFSEDRFYQLGGTPTRRIVEILAQEQAKQVDVEQVAEEKEAYYIRSLTQVEPILPVTRIVYERHGQVPMGVASGSERAILLQTLRHIGLDAMFDCIVASEDTQRHKPEPDVFLRAAELLKVTPQHCCVYEDSDLGIEAAHRAGMTWVDIRQFHTPRRWT